MKFRNGKIYKVKENSLWGVIDGGKPATRTISTTDKLWYGAVNDWLIKENGYYIEHASNHIDKFEPYITEEDAKMYKREEIRSAELAMQALLSNESVIPSADFNLKAVARTSCQMASALVREMIDEEFWDE